MQSEKEFLQDIANILEGMQVTGKNFTFLEDGYRLRDYYDRMADYGFEHPQEVMQAVVAMKYEMTDPTANAREERIEKWKKDDLKMYNKALEKVIGKDRLEKMYDLATAKSLLDKYKEKDPHLLLDKADIGFEDLDKDFELE